MVKMSILVKKNPKEAEMNFSESKQTFSSDHFSSIDPISD